MKSRRASIIFRCFLSLSALFVSFVQLAAPTWGFADEAPLAKNSTSERRPQGFGSFSPGQAMTYEEVIESGYLFVDGEYVESPYEVEMASGEMRINGTDVTAYFPAPQPSQNPIHSRTRKSAGEGGGSYSGGSRFSLRRASDMLSADGVVFLVTGEKPITMDPNLADRLLQIFRNDEARHEATEEFLVWMPNAAENEVVSEWLETYQAPESLLTRIEVRFAERDATTDSVIAQHGATRRLDQWSYPLSVFGMVLVVAAIGHLLTRRPERESSPSKINLAPEAIRETNYSLILVAAMSGMDLVWTLLISQAGAMRELNPLGSKLLEDPLQLIIFKLTMTALAVALIFGLRRYRRAQVASWWGCLLFTILTVRWLTFNSLFV